MKTSLVSINIIKKTENKLLNDKFQPYLFYWDGETDIIEDIKKSDEFINKIKSACFNLENYSDSILAYFIYELNDIDEQYTDNILNIQDIFLLSDIDEDFYEEYIINIFKDLYKQVFNEDYKGKDNIIFNIYTKIKEKYKDKFIEESAVNYIRSILQKENKLSQTNIDFIISKLNNIIKKD